MNNPKLRAALFFPRRIVWLILTFLVMTAIISAFVKTTPYDPVQTPGLSMRTGQPVDAEIARRLPSTLRLLELATLVGMVLSAPIILVGALVLWLRGRVPLLGAVFQRLGQMGVTLGIAAPTFVLGLFLLYLFALELNWSPVGGWADLTSGSTFDLKHAILPTLTLSILPTCLVARSVLGEMAHHRLAAVGSRSAWLLHAVLSFVRHGLIQVIGMLGGVLVVEVIFFLPGIGRFLVESIVMQDYPLLSGLVSTFLVWSLVLRALADMVQGVDGFVLLKLQPVESEVTAPRVREKPSYATGLALVWIIFCLLLVIVPFLQGIGGLLTGRDRIIEQNLADRNLPPGSEPVEGITYVWGTDPLGRDIHRRARYAQGLLLLSSLLITLVVLVPALAGGVLAGHLAKRGTLWTDLLDDLVLFPAEVLTSLPGLVLLAFILAVTGPGGSNLWVWLALAFLLPRAVRMVRGWWAATPPRKSRWQRLVGIALGVLVLGTGLAVVTQPTMGFLGLGVQPPQPDLGAMLWEGKQFMRAAPYAVLRPGWALLFAAFGWFLLADTLLSKFGFHKREMWLELNR